MSPSAAESFLLVPAMPTPNGALHLGHVSGPYLKMDVIARALRRSGRRVALVSASDSWEMHVLPRAIREKRSPEEVCRTYHAAIEASFDELDIRLDSFFNPLERPWRERAEAIYRALYDEIPAQGRLASLVRRSEQIPYSTKHSQPVLGSHIAGQCPHCGVTDLGGFYCEDCGLEISPEDIVGHWSELPDDVSHWRRYDSAFLHINDPGAFKAQLEARCSDRRFVELAMESLSFNSMATRISHPANWGVALGDPRLSPGSVFFSYPGMYALSLLCGEEARSVLGTGENPFSRGSSVITVKSFGFDNTAPYLLAATAIGLTSPTWRPFDHYLTNFFATLDGRKFSTSGDHAIWANEARRELSASSDVLRAYLCHVNPEHDRKDFSRADFAVFKSRWQSRISALQQRTAGAPMERADFSELATRLGAQQHLLTPPHVDLARAFGTLEGWMDRCESRATPCAGPEWASAFATLAYPFMPRLAKAILDTNRAHDFASRLPGDLAGVDAVRSAYGYIRNTSAKTLIEKRDSDEYCAENA